MTRVFQSLKKEQANQVFRAGKSYSAKSIYIKVLKRENLNTQVAFSVGKGSFRKAVERNRAKRLLREAVQALAEKLNPGFDVVVIYKKRGLANSKLGLIEAKLEISNVFKKANLLRD